MNKLLFSHSSNLKRYFFCVSRFTLFGLVLFFQIPNALANCAFTSVTGVNFGVYDVFSTNPNNNGVGSMTVNCRGTTTSFVIALSSGLSNSFLTRTMKSGSSVLNYNLYTNAVRNSVWGDGTVGSVTQSGLGNGKTVLNIFGQIFSGQDAKVGLYSDTLFMTVSF